jgi:hypothetical protein
MNGFEFLFSFYSLLLGLAVANVATGFADIWRGRRETPVGTPTVLLGLLILFSAAQQWMSFWRGRDSLTMGRWQILVSIAVALPFVFISRAMPPESKIHGDHWMITTWRTGACFLRSFWFRPLPVFHIIAR